MFCLLFEVNCKLCAAVAAGCKSQFHVLGNFYTFVQEFLSFKLVLLLHTHPDCIPYPVLIDILQIIPSPMMETNDKTLDWLVISYYLPIQNLNICRTINQVI